MSNCGVEGNSSYNQIAPASRIDLEREHQTSMKLRSNQENLPKPIDAWIDELDPLCDMKPELISNLTMNQITMQMLCNQNLPKVNVSTFDGSPLQWVDFAIDFREIIHAQHHLTGTQRMVYRWRSKTEHSLI